MSDTPRTEKANATAAACCGEKLPFEWVTVEFARQLERELAALREDRRKLVEALRFLRDYTYTDAEEPELRAQNQRCHLNCAQLLRELGENI